MGKKKHKDRHGDKHGRKQDAAAGARHDREQGDGSTRAGSFSLPLAGIAAMVTQQLQSPAARAAMATGLRAAADALSKPASRPQPPAPPQPPEPPHAAATGPVPPAEPTGAPNATRSPNPDAIAGAIGDAAELVLARLFGKKG